MKPIEIMQFEFRLQFLTRPTVLAAIAITFLNDHYLKASSFSGFITGKISDFSGLYFAPFVVMECLVIVAALCKLSTEPRFSITLFGLVCCLIGLVFVTINTSTTASQYYVEVLENMFPGSSFQNVVDATDLIALIMVVVAFLHFKKMKAYMNP